MNAPFLHQSHPGTFQHLGHGVAPWGMKNRCKGRRIVAKRRRSLKTPEELSDEGSKGLGVQAVVTYRSKLLLFLGAGDGLRCRRGVRTWQAGQINELRSL